MRNLILQGGLLAALVSAGAAQERALVNTDKNGLALAGYDPVSYFSATGPVKGESGLTATHLGATYRFATTENRDRFLQDPTRFAPQFGGYCGYGVSRNYLVGVDPEAFTIMDGRLILQNSKRVLDLWKREPEARLALADRNWPDLLEREGKRLP